MTTYDDCALFMICCFMTRGFTVTFDSYLTRSLKLSNVSNDLRGTTVSSTIRLYFKSDLWSGKSRSLGNV